MTSGQNDARLRTYPSRLAGGMVLQLLRQLVAADHLVVKRTRAQERQPPRKSARLEILRQKKPALAGGRKAITRHDSNSGTCGREVCQLCYLHGKGLTVPQESTQQQLKSVSRKRSRPQIRGATHLQCLIDSVNEGWNNSIPITKTRPQPDYAVGFRREAFKQEQLDRMHPIVGDFDEQSYFMATWYMYFPFLTCEVKCGAAALDIADRQNAHSAAIAVRAVVELFRSVKREKELHREILAFSISHDHCSVRIHGYYAEFEGANTKYYRHTIHKFDFTAMDGKEKWTAYKFTKNVYDNWMPKHFERICSAVEQIPADISFSVSQSELRYPEQSSGLSQDFSAYSIDRSSVEYASDHPQDDTQSSTSWDSAVTPATSVHGDAPFKIRRKEYTRRGRK